MGSVYYIEVEYRYYSTMLDDQYVMRKIMHIRQAAIPGSLRLGLLICFDSNGYRVDDGFK